ncbi:MAG TPA: leucine-rich repeat domain-containing protein [Pyrinomonadaceae bacterium]|nr:leucine-rich repeat domain-containing protein [Pyrinomonadaceae bacterium]
MTGSSLTGLTIGLISLSLFAPCAGGTNARRPSVAALHGAAATRLYTPTQDEPQEGSYDSLEAALREPEKAKRLALGPKDGDEASLKMKHLPPGLGRLVNLEALELACLESLEDLPEEVGNLTKLESIVIDNGNGCSMNVRLPRSIGQLGSLKVLRLYGALDGRDIGEPARSAKSKLLPDTLGQLQNLEELDLGRNGIRALPAQVASLRNLKKLSLDYNDLHDLPAFVGELKNLEELSLNANGGVRLPQSLAAVKGLKIYMGNNRLTLAAQKALRARFPAATFSFENEYDDDAANQEAPKPRTRRGRR